MLYVISKGLRGVAWFGCFSSQIGFDFQMALITDNSSSKFCIWFQGVVVGVGGWAF